MRKKLLMRIFSKYQTSSILKRFCKCRYIFCYNPEKVFLWKKRGAALGIRADLQAAVQSREFAEQMKDIIEYRTMAYYQRRYRNEE